MLLFILSSCGIIGSLFLFLTFSGFVLLDIIISKFNKPRSFTKKEFFKYLKISFLVFYISSVCAFGSSELLENVIPMKSTIQEEITDFDTLLIEENVSIEISDNDTFKVVKTTTYIEYDEPLWKEIILFPLPDSTNITYTVYVPREFAK